MHTELSQQIASLNPQQRDAVYADVNRPTLIHAGAGTGKTKVSNCRIGRLIADGIADPDRILSVTFTRKAAQESRERLTAYVGEELARQVHIGNFHAIGVKMLRAMPDVAGFAHDGFTVLDEQEQQSVLATIAWRAGYIAERTATLQGGASATRMRIVFQQIQSWKENAITPSMAMELHGHSIHLRPIVDLYTQYQDTLRERMTCDYADLLLLPLDAMRRNPRIRNHWADKFQYIQVDEYQDTNTLQVKWLHMLADQHHHLFAVGDPDQSMYRWRGARPEVMTKFAREWPNAIILPLEQNYRSTQEILDPANQIVAPTSGATIKTLTSTRHGEAPSFIQYYTEHEEADAIATQIEACINRGERSSEIAILLRTHALFAPYEQALRAHAIPYESGKQQDYMQREEVRNILTLIRLASNPADEHAFLRLCGQFGNTVQDNEAWIIIQAARRMGTNTPLYQACDTTVQQRLVPMAYAPGIQQVATQLTALHDTYTQAHASIADLIRALLAIVPAMDVSDPEVSDTVDDILSIAEPFISVNAYLDYLSIHAVRQKQRRHGVAIMTVHAAKGLEFDRVFAPCTEEKILPNTMAMRAPEGLQEERNIAHVLWTRARKHLHISCAKIRGHEPRQPSRFLKEAGIVDELPRPIKAQKNEGRVLPAHRTIMMVPVHIQWTKNIYKILPPNPIGAYPSSPSGDVPTTGDGT